MGSRSSTRPPDVTPVEDPGKLAEPLVENGCFKNPFPTYREPTFRNLMSLIWAFQTQDKSNVPSKEMILNQTLPMEKPDFKKFESEPGNNLKYMWVGHASCLVKVDDLTILTDPVWAQRCGPFGIFGPKRYRDVVCSIEELPDIDAVVISHNHYDHLDHSAVKKLNARFQDRLCWFVAQGQAQWMKDAGCKTVVELSWWGEHTLKAHGKEYLVAATPTQHWCKRTATDTNKALWCSWVVKGPRHSFYFAGDTGYCYAFKQIGRIHGPFSLAAIPIGAYEPRWFMQPQHVNTDEAVEMHKDLRSEQSVGIHWGTFKLTNEPYMEPKEKLEKILNLQKLPLSSFVTVKHGEIVDFLAKSGTNGDTRNTSELIEETKHMPGTAKQETHGKSNI
ncbi:N-acyl-phosphatidylethanolamine-hydrolyzing phospholipase D-like [Dreissena polymorpha]|uniref:N-acetylphosphatidylethanolamine-hydrolyzing phospholipase D n=1 Tax=Dreissena polymorpha TaxID=45954 RepID=A0A9D4JNW9_DREPO|nr:N-acyl-phosphatidylethanolamine-hydrolyzing phospholipase D-like [Dreissena polymorpha]XP_052286563.1 N-acyl-phosphatidylethanolamine-hydrolyzing phospholipase D-like [Dreissena polymorpha]KAH3819066.1 hypothetical protein DPMN_120796 [Dreissena polymorpha]